MWLANISIKQPVLISMVLFAIMLTGFSAYRSMPVDLFPDVSFPIVVVTTALPGASPEEVASQLTKPVEESVTSLANVHRVSSTSTEGVSRVLIEFNLGYSVDQGAGKVREQLDQVKVRLPTDATDPLLLRFDPSAQPILTYGVADKTGAMSPRDLRTFVTEKVKPRLERVDGVGQVVVTGGEERQIQVLLSLDALRARGVTVTEISNALQSQNLTVPGGRLNGSGQELLVKTDGQFRSIADIEKAVVAVRNGVPLQVRDIATVVDGSKDAHQYNRLNGNDSVILTVRKQSGSNTVRAAEDVKKALTDMGAEFPSLNAVLIVDQSESIRESNNDVTTALILGGLAAAAVVYLFFRDLRNTLVTVAGLPVIVLGTFLVINFLGYSINMMTLMALSLSIGLLIDDAIVVRENIFRHMEAGEEPRPAALHGTAEIAFAVIATSLSILAVFVPVAFTSGIIGQFFRQFGITVAVAVAISMFEAFTLAPLLSAYFFHRLERPEAEAMGTRAKPLVRMYAAFVHGYVAVLNWGINGRLRLPLPVVGRQGGVWGFHRPSIAGRWGVAAGAFGVFVVSMMLTSMLGVQFFGAQDNGQLVAGFSLDPGTPLKDTDYIAREMERYLLAQPEVSDVYTSVGGGGSAESASVSVKLHAKGHTDAFVAQLRDQFGAVPKLAFSNQSVGGNSGSSAIATRTMLLSVTGGDRVTDIEPLTAALQEKMTAIPGMVDVDRSYVSGRPELHVTVDRTRASDLGASAALVSGTVRTLLNGDTVTRFRDGESEWDVLVQLREPDRTRLADVLGLQIPTTRGTTVPLGSVAAVVNALGPTQVDRENRAPQIFVGGNVKGRPESAVRTDLVQAMKDLALPPGVKIDFAGNAQTSNESFGALLAALGLAIIFLYMVLASQFGSFIHPFTIMMSLPMAFGGAFAGLLVAHKNFDIMAMIGLIFLMGLVTKNAILLIDFILRARARGMPRNEAILEAGPQRLRPILMTTLAMMAGMLPTALALSPGSEWRSAMGITVIGGLITSTLLTLVVVPVFYTFLDDLPGGLRRVWRFGGRILGKAIGRRFGKTRELVPEAVYSQTTQVTEREPVGTLGTH